MNERLLNEFTGGIDLVGFRQPDGTIKPVVRSGEVISEWPETITVFGNTYSLEEVKKWPNGYEQAIYC